LIVERLFDQDDHSLFAVFDGHGTEGHKAANFVKEMFVKVLENYRQLLIVDPATAMKRAFRDIHDLLIENDDIDTYMSGTTASVVVWRGDQLIVANLGDSRVVLGRKALSAAQRATNPYASIKSAPAQAIDLTT
jgi:serine/threonine protein phosphatase PrpC